jgi:glycosyltransferase involved in cell wall biosynthesis
MSTLVVLHETTRTGAPRVGGLIAAALQKHDDVHVVCLDDGAIVGWLRERLGENNVSVIDFAGGRHRIPFGDRIAIANKALAETASELVYVNSAAAAEFVFAAKALGKTIVLHVHENAAMLRRLLEIDLAKMEMLSLCDGVVLAAGNLRRDLAEVFGIAPEPCLDFGIAIDTEEVARLASLRDAPARNALGEVALWGERLVIGMCGHASARKGADIFFAAAAALPAHDFVWVGNWDREDAPENDVIDQYLERRLPNLYVTGGVDNPYKYIARFDLFFLSSRVDPNPLVLAEAMSLGVPVLCFSRTTAVADFLGRSAILCHGTTNIADSMRVLSALDPSEFRSVGFHGSREEVQRRFEITLRTPALLRFLASLRT